MANTTAHQKVKKKTSRLWIILAILLVVGLIACYSLFFAAYLLIGSKPSFLSRGAVAIIRLDGVITGSGGEGGLLSETASVSPEQIQADIKQALEDNTVKAILIRVNSPGGTASASQEIYAEVKKAAKKKPVVASISDVGASGAYYAVSPAQVIMANPASSVGSIGVFIEIPIYRELLNRLGIKFEIIKEGKFKTIGDPSREMTPEERQILQRQTKIIYNQFVNDVAAARAKKISFVEVKKVANGLVFPGSEALELKLVDKLGNYREAIKIAAKLGKIKGEPEIVEYEKPGFIDLLSRLNNQKLNLSLDFLKEALKIRQR